MGSRFLAGLVGVVLGVAVILSLVLFLSRPAEVEKPEEAKTLTNADLSELKQKTTGLENFGNLPVVVSADEIGRDNPFGSY
ncbi:MAG: hypothetical protein OEV37_01090 [Candidatus Berkelbacteria bacterium]|nr:hypothetical protein [Candidatus Berkelbacteria bacterium]